MTLSEWCHGNEVSPTSPDARGVLSVCWDVRIADQGETRKLFTLSDYSAQLPAPNSAVIWLTPKPQVKRYDVRASCHELDGEGADGAYDLLLDNVTAEEITAQLADVLKGNWGLYHAGDCRLTIHIVPSGRGDDCPL